jgi:hypothetical protein
VCTGALQGAGLECTFHDDRSKMNMTQEGRKRPAILCNDRRRVKRKQTCLVLVERRAARPVYPSCPKKELIDLKGSSC